MDSLRSTWGLIPLLLALLSWRLRGASVTDRWLSWSVLVACLASLGWYSLGWLMHEVRCGLLGAAPDDILVGYPVGRRLLAHGGIASRLCVLPVSRQAASHSGTWVEYSGRPAGRTPGSQDRLPDFRCYGYAWRVSVWRVRPSFWVVSQYGWQQWLSAAPASDYFGPLDAAGARRDILRSLMHTALLCLIMLGIWRVDIRRAAEALSPVAGADGHRCGFVDRSALDDRHR